MRMTDEAGEIWVVEETGPAPTPKVATAGVAGALAVLAVWVAGLFDVSMTPEVGAALAAVLAFAAGYLKRDGSKIEWADDGHADLNGVLTTVLVILGIIALLIFIF